MTARTIGGWAFLLSGAATLSGVALVGCIDEEPARTAAASASPVSVVAPDGAYVFSVPDMHCEFACAPKVQQTLADMPGVDKVETDVAAHTATVYVADGFDETKALAALADAGYPSKTLAK